MLELIESVLTNYHKPFRKIYMSLLYTLFILQHEQFLMLLKHHLCPMLLKSLS